METTRPSLLLCIRNRDDVDAWMLFDTIYRPVLHRYARTWGLDHSDSEDVVQHTLTALHQQGDGFKYDTGRGRFRSWLRTIVNNRIRNLLRDRGREAERREEFAATSAKHASALSDEDVFEQVWLQEHLWHCLRELQTEVDEQTYQIFMRHVLEDRPAAAVAAEFGVEPGNVYTIKWRLTKQIAERMRFLTREDAT